MHITVDNFKNIFGMLQKEEANLIKIIPQKHTDIGGGTLLKEEIDQLENKNDYDYCLIMGLKQGTFEYFIKTYASRFKGIFFFKNKLVEDWSLLGNLVNIEFIYYFHNQRITKLWDMSLNTKLKGLIINDFTRLNSLVGINKAKGLEYFEFGDEIWRTSKLESVLPLSGMKIKGLGFYGKCIMDEDYSFFEKLPDLKEFNCPINFLPLEVICWMVANFPNLQGRCLRAYEDWGEDVCISGKRKPILKKGDLRIENYIKKYNDLIKKYHGLSYKDAFINNIKG